MALHGTFDFSLFVMGYLEFAYSIDSAVFMIFSLVTPVAITIAGVVWAYVSFNKVGSVCSVS